MLQHHTEIPTIWQLAFVRVGIERERENENESEREPKTEATDFLIIE